MSVFKKQFIKELQDFANEKNIPLEEAMEIIIDTIKTVWINRYATDSLEIRYEPKKANLVFDKKLKVVAQEREIVDEISEILYEDAIKMNPKAKIGDIILDPINPIEEFNRVMIQEFREKFAQNILMYFRDKEYDQFLPLLHKVVPGIVKSAKNDNVIISINGVNTLLPRRETVISEKLREGEKIYVFVKELHKEYQPGIYQVIVSRKGTEIVQSLLEEIIPEILNNQIGVYKIVRIAGFKTKICLQKLVETINPISVAVGYHGNRVRSLIKELRNELVEFFEYDNDVRVLLGNMLNKLKITAETFNCDYDNRTVTVVIKDSDIYQAIGKNGYEVSMMRQFLPEPFERMVLVKASESNRVDKDFAYNFGSLLNLDEEITAEMQKIGINYINQIVKLPEQEYLDMMTNVGLEESLAKDIRERAEIYSQSKYQQFIDIPGASTQLFMYYNLEPDASISLAENGILSVNDMFEYDKETIVRILKSHMIERDIVDLLMGGGEF